MPDYYIVAKPGSGRGTGAHRIPAIKQQLGQHSRNDELQRTERPGQALELARAAAAWSFGVAAGGDGTIHGVEIGFDAIVGFESLKLAPLSGALPREVV